MYQERHLVSVVANIMPFSAGEGPVWRKETERKTENQVERLVKRDIWKQWVNGGGRTGKGKVEEWYS